MRLLLIALALLAATAHAETWRQIADLDKKGGHLLLDTASIDRGSDVRTASFKSVFTFDHSIGEGFRDVPAGVRSYRWESNRGQFNCTTRTVAVSQSTLHDADGQIVGKFDVDASALTFREVPPASFGGLLLRAVCAPEADLAVGLATITHIVNPEIGRAHV